MLLGPLKGSLTTKQPDAEHSVWPQFTSGLTGSKWNFKSPIFSKAWPKTESQSYEQDHCKSWLSWTDINTMQVLELE